MREGDSSFGWRMTTLLIASRWKGEQRFRKPQKLSIAGLEEVEPKVMSLQPDTMFEVSARSCLQTNCSWLAWSSSDEEGHSWAFANASLAMSMAGLSDLSAKSYTRSRNSCGNLNNSGTEAWITDVAQDITVFWRLALYLTKGNRMRMEGKP